MSRNKIIFTIFGAVLCLIMLSYFLYAVLSDGGGRSKPDIKDKVAAATVVKPLSAADQLLHNGFGRLQSMDQAYALRLLDSTTTEYALDSMSNHIVAMEKTLKESIDSLEKLNASGREKCESAGFYKKVLSERGQLQSNIAKTVKQKELDITSAFSPGEMQGLQLQMLKKDERIGMLENQLKLVTANLSRQPSSNTSAATETATTAVYREESVTLAEKLSKKELAYNILQERYFTLEQERNNLRKQSEPKNPSTLITSEQRVSELEAALKLSEVECNLTRADGSQIISNSKQRKSLLEQSLKILNSMSSSNSPEVQKQAREKLTELKAIASMIRD